jgi:hypothetical protein
MTRFNVAHGNNASQPPWNIAWRVNHLMQLRASLLFAAEKLIKQASNQSVALLLLLLRNSSSKK